MKEKYMLTRADDLSAVPSDELKEDTLAKMEAAVQTAPVKHKKTTAKRILACAALVSAMFMLMSAGYRVFSYLAYVPGKGIVMQDTDRVYVLKTASDADGYRIDAISMVPIQEGEHKGQWEVTMLTEYPDTFFASEDGTPLSELPITIQSADGTTCQLTYDTNYIDHARYSGYIDSAAAGSWEITRWGSTCTVVLTPASKLSYANYRYPTESGFTMICYPVSENSDILAMTIDYSQADENLRYWLDNSSSYNIFADVKVTDINGDTYKRSHDISSYAYDGVNYICRLDRPLEAPAAVIQISNLIIDMRGEFADVQVTIPEEGKTVSLNQPIVNHHGVSITMQNISAAVIPSQHRKNVFFNSFTMHTVTASPLVSGSMRDVFYSLSFRMADDPDKKTEYINGKYIQTNVEDTIIRRTKEYLLRDDSLPIRFGEDVTVILTGMTTQLFDTWTIDFTASTEDTGIPKEAIRYGK